MFLTPQPAPPPHYVTQCAILTWQEEGGVEGGWALNLAYDPVVQQGTLLLHNLVCVCMCVCARLQYAVVRLPWQLLLVSVYVFF